MRIIDVSLTLSNSTPVWPGDPAIQLGRINKMEEGANSNVSRITMGVHSGTHIDAPVHFGVSEKGVDDIRLDELIGPCFVVEMPDEVDLIDRQALEKVHIPAGSTRLLFKTRNSKLWADGIKEFDTHFVAITEDAARFLVERGTRLVGVDYLSVAPYKHSTPTHETLLRDGLVIIEGLDLHAVTGGYYSLICLPLKLAGSDGAPARAALIDEV